MSVHVRIAYASSNSNHCLLAVFVVILSIPIWSGVWLKRVHAYKKEMAEAEASSQDSDSDPEASSLSTSVAKRRLSVAVSGLDMDDGQVAEAAEIQREKTLVKDRRGGPVAEGSLDQSTIGNGEGHLILSSPEDVEPSKSLTGALLEVASEATCTAVPVHPPIPTGGASQSSSPANRQTDNIIDGATGLSVDLAVHSSDMPGTKSDGFNSPTTVDAAIGASQAEPCTSFSGGDKRPEALRASQRDSINDRRRGVSFDLGQRPHFGEDAGVKALPLGVHHGGDEAPPRHRTIHILAEAEDADEVVSRAGSAMSARSSPGDDGNKWPDKAGRGLEPEASGDSTLLTLPPETQPSGPGSILKFLPPRIIVSSIVILFFMYPSTTATILGLFQCPCIDIDIGVYSAYAIEKQCYYSQVRETYSISHLMPCCFVQGTHLIVCHVCLQVVLSKASVLIF